MTRRALETHRYIADVAPTGAHALRGLAESVYDVVVLDVGLPDVSGFEVCREIRRREIWTPILMLTARTAVDDRVEGLDAGADDYIPKPYTVSELLARVRALARRGPVRGAPVLRVDPLELNPATHEVTRAGIPLDLSAREFALLEAFMRHPGQVLTRDALLDQAWPAGSEQKSNVVDVYVNYLREKIDRPFGAHSLETVRGVGYRLRRPSA